jgi:hypothetical protein
MSDASRTDRFDVRAPEVVRPFIPLPPWVADRVLQADEVVTWVRGPALNPPWERLVTHPALFVVGALLAASCLAVGVELAGGWADVSPALFLAAIALFLGSVFVLGISNGYFTRLVVTNVRIFIVQGREICRSWDIDCLPRSLIHHDPRGGERSRTIDLDALKTMLGGTSDQFTDSKTILALGKQLDRIKTREDDRQ